MGEPGSATMCRQGHMLQAVLRGWLRHDQEHGGVRSRMWIRQTGEWGMPCWAVVLPDWRMLCNGVQQLDD